MQTSSSALHKDKHRNSANQNRLQLHNGRPFDNSSRLDFADNTKVNIVGILRKWKGYCQSAELGPWKKVIQKADRAMAMDFLHHLCETYNIKSESTSWEYSANTSNCIAVLLAIIWTGTIAERFSSYITSIPTPGAGLDTKYLSH